MPQYSTLISGTAADETIENFLDAASIDAGSGNDTVFNSGAGVNINAGAGDDLIQSGGENVTIHAGMGADTIEINGEHNFVYGENDADSIVNYSDGNSINGGLGADYISNEGDNVAVDGGADDDTIENSGGHSTILSGLGNDLVNNWGVEISINAGAGNDTIFNHSSAVNIDAGAGDDAIYNENSEVMIIAGVGNDTVYNRGDFASIDGGLGNDSIVNYGEAATIQTGAGDDSVDVYADGSLVRSDGGTLRVNVDNELDASIVGSRNNDAIILTSSLSSAVVTVRTDAGNDSILASDGRERFQYGEGDGEDVIWGYESTDTIHWTNGAIEQTLIGTEDVTLTANKGSLTLKNVLGKRITIVDNEGNISQRTFSQGSTINNSSNNVSLAGSSGNDTIINSGAGVTINAGDADDWIENSGEGTKISAGEGNDTVNNEGARTSIDGGLGNDSIFNAFADYVTINAGRGLNSITNYGSYSSIVGGADGDLIWNSGFKIISSGELITSGQRVTLNGGDGDDTITNYGPSVAAGGGERGDSIANFGNYASINGEGGDDTITNRGLYVTLSGGAGYDVIRNTGDYSVLDGGGGNDSLIGSDGAIETFYYTDGDDTILNYGREDTIQLGAAYTSTAISGRDFVINTEVGSIKVRNGANMAINVRNISNRLEILNEENDELATLAANERVVQKLSDGMFYSSDQKAISVNSVYVDLLDSRKYAESIETIDASKMRSSIELIGNDNNNVIRAGSGGSLIKSGAGSNTLYGGAGEDFFVLGATSYDNVIDNYDNGDIIQLSSGRVVDSAINGSDVLLQLSSGTLLVKRAANKEIHILEAGNSEAASSTLTFTNSNNNTTLTGSGGGDRMRNSGSNVVVNALGGNDSIVSNGSNVLINAGEGADTINSSDNNSTINGGIGDDLIITSGSDQTIIGGSGSDTITANGYRITYDYSSGDVNDLITNYKSGDKLRLHNVSISDSSIDGANVLLRLGTGIMTIANAVDSEITIVNSRGEEYTAVFSEPVDETTSPPPLDDTTSTAPIDDTTSTLPLDDTTSTVPLDDTTSTVPIDDTTSTVPIDDTTSTTVRDDTTSTVRHDDTTSTAPSDDTTSTTGRDDTTSIADDTTEEDTYPFDDTTLVYDDDTTSTAPTVDDTTSASGGDDTMERPLMTQRGVIEAFVHSLDETTLQGASALDEAIRACSEFSSIDEAIEQFLEDCRNASSALEFLTDKCGIKLGNADTGAISGSDAGGSTTKTAESIVPENEDDTAYPEQTTFEIDGLTLTVPNQRTLTDVQQTIIRGLYNWWIGGGLELNEESYGLSFDESGTTVKRMNVTFDNNVNNKTLAAVNYSYNSSNGKTTSLSLKIPMAYYASLEAGDVNGTTADGFSYLDRTIAHEMTHALMAANVNYFYRLPLFVTEGLAELTHGIDDTRGREIYRLAGDPDSLATYLDTSRRSGAETGDYSSGFMFFRWLAKQSATTAVEPEDDTAVDDTTSEEDTYPFDDTTSEEDTSSSDDTSSEEDTTSIEDDTSSEEEDTTSTEDDTTSAIADDTSYSDYPLPNGLTYAADYTGITVDNNYKEKRLDVSNYDPRVITVDASKVTRMLSIEGNNLDNEIHAGRRGGSLAGGEGDDTLCGGTGIDVFVYEGGEDAVVDFTPNRDKIKLVNATLEGYEVNGTDVELITNDGVITVKDALDQKIKITDARGKTTNKIYDAPLPEGANYNASRTIVKFTADFEGAFDALDFNPKIKMLNASKVENEIELFGNDNNNIIKLGSGGGTVDGGDGNDKLYGGDGADVFIYNFGKDTINKYVAGEDRIVLDNDEVQSVRVSGRNVTLMFEEGSLTINKAKGERLTITDSEGDTGIYSFGKTTSNFRSGLIEANVGVNELAVEGDPFEGDPFEAANVNVYVDELAEILPIENISVDGDPFESDPFGASKNYSAANAVDVIQSAYTKQSKRSGGSEQF